MVFASLVLLTIPSALLFLVLVRARKDPLFGQLVFVLEVLLHRRKMLHFTSEAAERRRLNVHVCRQHFPPSVHIF